MLNEFTHDSRVLKEALSLKKAGYHVTILALHGSNLLEDEVVGGVRVRRLKLWTRGWPRKKPVQLLKYLEFFTRAIIACRHASILHCNDLNTLPIGVAVKMIYLHQIKLIYDAHEFEIDVSAVRRRYQLYLISFFEGLLLRYVDAIITVSYSIAKAYRRIYKVRTPALVLNCPPYRASTSKPDRLRQELSIRPDQVIFLYQGGLTSGRGIEKLVEAFSMCHDEKAVIVFMGYGQLESFVRFAAEAHPNILYHPAVSPNELLDYTASADIGLVYIEPTCLNRKWCLPNKFFEYLMADLTIVSSDLVEVRRIMNRYPVGVVAPDASLKGLIETLNMAMQRLPHPYDSLPSNAKCEYSWEAQERTLLGVYQSIEIST